MDVWPVASVYYNFQGGRGKWVGQGGRVKEERIKGVYSDEMAP